MLINELMIFFMTIIIYILYTYIETITKELKTSVQQTTLLTLFWTTKSIC